jgi:hypothetical protein
MGALQFIPAFENPPHSDWTSPPHLSDAPVAAPVDPAQLEADVALLAPVCESGGLQAYLAEAPQIPHVLQEIGRLREITFRAVGEGTGRALDLDRFDRHYLHLFLWNPEKREVAGGYRLCSTAGGPHSLYTSTLFDYGDAMLDRLGPALELGRSFVRLEYQRSFAPLLLLWKAIGCYVARNPQFHTLFGPVSISAHYQPASRERMMTFLMRRSMESTLRHLIRPRQAPRLGETGFACLSLEELDAQVAAIEPDGKGIPVLLRHYWKLGGRVLAFSVDREFSNALDGFIVVDLARTEPRLLARYLGKTEAEAFLAHQKGLHGTSHRLHSRLAEARHAHC